MTKGDRVWLVNHSELDRPENIVVGTIISRTKVGYTQVNWDGTNVYPDWFSPESATRFLRIVFGDDALPRHDWDVEATTENPPCTQCGVIQTNDNEFAPCRK